MQAMRMRFAPPAQETRLTGITTAGAGAILLTASATPSMKGKVVKLISGTNFTVGIYVVSSVVDGVSLTLDRAAATGVGANGVILIGVGKPLPLGKGCRGIKL